ncbi:MAG: AAA family ATPase, partial [Deltaproteobacteria bacterium]
RTTIEFRKLSEAEQRLSLLYQLAEALRSLSDLSGMLERFMGVIFSTLDPERAYIGIFDPKLGWVYEVAKTEHGKKRESFRKSTQIVEWVRREGKAFITGNIQQSGDLAWTRATLNEGIRSAMCSPIIDIEGKDIGVIYIDDRKRAHFFKEEDLRFFVFLGLILGKFISNALLHDLLRRRMIAMEAQQPVEELVFGNSAAMQTLKQQFEELAETDFTLLLLGETGTGKTIFARKIHERSGRKGPFVELNCSAIPENLFESELFGYAPRSGIANADPRGRKGKFELADGGTLFLDEIGDMSYDQQARLLKALEEKQFYPIGATRPVKVDVRIIAATNRDLKGEVARKCFREDLFYRLSEVPPFTLPPLRERKEDMPVLCEHILYQLLREEFPRKRITGFSPAAMAALSAYDWPGNFRELKQFLRFALIAAPAGRHELEPSDFPQEISAAPPGAPSPVEIRLTRPDEAFSPTDLAKRDKVVEVLRASRSNR